jgi:tetrahydromethanopterin S-methyltransferase subunit A
MSDPFKAPWPLVPGSYSIGSTRSPTALVVVGRARFQLAPTHYCILGYLRSANLGIEKVIANVISNSRIRFLVVCGREEGHLPADALISLVRNGVDPDMRIIGTRAQLSFLPDIKPETVARFREQIKVIDLVNPKDCPGIIDWQDPPFDLDASRQKELEEVVEECERSDPGPYPGEPMVVTLPEPFQSMMEMGAVMNKEVDRVSDHMLRMPSEKLSTRCEDVIVSPEFEVLIDPVDWVVVQLPSLAIYSRMKAYLTGE